MKIQSPTPVPLELQRGGGSVITTRLDFWSSTPSGWELAGSSLFQAVTKPREVQLPALPPGTYTSVLTCFVEESVNGIYAFDMSVNGVSIAKDHGNVDTSTSPHDSKVYKDQFVLVVQ